MKTINQTGLPQKAFWSARAIQLFTLLTISIGALSLDVFLVTLDSLQQAFQISQFQLSLVVSLWSAGVCSGQFFFGPLMDATGRKKAFLLGMLLTAVTSFPCLLIKDFNWILFFRFCHGFGISAQLLIARAVIIDIFSDRKQQAQAFSWNIFFTLLFAFLAPLFAAFMVTTFGWKSLFLALGIVSSIISLLIIGGFPETLPVEKRQKLSLTTQAKGYFFLLSDKVYLGYTFIGSLALFWIFAHFVGSPYMFNKVFQLTTYQLSLFLSACMLCGIFASLLNRYLLHFYSVDTLLKCGERAFLLHVTLLLGITFLGLKLAPLFIVNMLFGNMTIAFLTSNALAAAVSYEQERAGTAAAVYGIFQFASGAIASALMGIMIDLFIKLGYPNSTLPMPLFFFTVGILIVLCRFTLLRNR